MRTILVGMASGLIALVGLAGNANASATVELIWQGDDGTISGLTVSDSITMDVVITAGPNGSNGGQVSVDYSDAVGSLSVTGFSNTLDGYWFFSPNGDPTDPGDNIIHSVNAGSICGSFGSCLANGESQRIGTITFHVDALPGGTVEFIPFLSAIDGDGIGDAIGGDACTPGPCTFTSGFAVVPEPGTLSLLSMGLGGLYVVGRRNRRKR